MNPDPWKKRLVEDLFAKTFPEDFHSNLVKDMIAERQKSILRHRWSMAALAASILLAIGVVLSFLWQQSMVNSNISTVATRKELLQTPTFTNVKTIPLEPAQIVHTRSSTVLPPPSISQNVFVIENNGREFQFIYTTLQSVEFMTDEDLLKFVDGYAACLVKDSPTTSRLIFLDDRGERQFFRRAN